MCAISSTRLETFLCSQLYPLFFIDSVFRFSLLSGKLAVRTRYNYEGTELQDERCDLYVDWSSTSNYRLFRSTESTIHALAILAASEFIRTEALHEFLNFRVYTLTH